ncbi:MAG: branched-chain amino acid ABC transporter permease [Spirochaetes bacterium]|nr:branched-chain amino acid ABC transporter permease [Spirochaetota bacterium]
MFSIKNMTKAFFISLWIMILTFPLAVIKVNTIDKTVNWRWFNLIYIGIITFITAFLWDYFLKRNKEDNDRKKKSFLNIIADKKKYFNRPEFKTLFYGALFVVIMVFPFVSGLYQINVMTTALIYVMLGLGLNIVVGLGGLLNLGYVAFYAVGAYSYALLNKHFGINFWIALPIGALFSMLFGLIIGFPVLRLRGDYLAIVTLAFGEIVRIVLENWNEFSFGPSGISGIPRPGLFGLKMNLMQNSILIYFIMIVLTAITVFVVNRLENSRLGRTWVAMREDEIACQTMGINVTKAKLTAFALGALWAGLAGVMFAAKTTFINPASFTIWESIIILCIVVLGGMGSILGVIIASFILIILPESLRFFSDYRMLVFGAILVVMMIFRPGGIINAKRKVYQYKGKKD